MGCVNVVNNLRNPILQLGQYNSPLRLYVLDEQIVREKHMLGTLTTGLDKYKGARRIMRQVKLYLH